MFRDKAGTSDGATLCENTLREKATKRSRLLIDQVENVLRFGSFDTRHSETALIEHFSHCMNESSIHGNRAKQALSVPF